MKALHNMLESVLNGFYPEIIFDVSGLSRLLLPCLIAVLAGLIVTLLLKLFRPIRRFSYVAIVAVLIAMIAANAFFPESLGQAGDYAAESIEQLAAMEQPEPEP